jgi:tRNA (adenine22-N1)-methyltransferase
MNRLSERLLHIAEQVKPGNTLADVGTDHGYLPIYLLQRQQMHRCIAMDVNEGPLLRAQKHIADEGLGDYIETRLGNGLERLEPGEADAVVIAGMGGGLTMDILVRGREIVRGLDQLILEPQSQLPEVRRFLREQNYFVEAEDLVLEDGKYYPILRVLPRCPDASAAFAKAHGLSVETVDAYGAGLLEGRHPILRSFLEKEHMQCEQILAGLPETGSAEDAGSARIRARSGELRRKLAGNQEARGYLCN